MRLSHEIITVHTKHRFAIARGGSSEYRVVRVTVTDGDSAQGWGEAAPNRFYGESVESVAAALARFAPLLESADPWASRFTVFGASIRPRPRAPASRSRSRRAPPSSSSGSPRRPSTRS
jgi:hypothetical protein